MSFFEQVYGVFGLGIKLLLMVVLYAVALKLLTAFIRPGGNANRIMGMSVGSVMAIIAAQSYTRCYDGRNDMVSLGILLGGFAANIILLVLAYSANGVKS